MGDEGKFSEYELLQIEKTSEAIAKEVASKMVCIPHCKERHLKLYVALGAIGFIALYAAGLNSAPIIRALIGLVI